MTSARPDPGALVLLPAAPGDFCRVAAQHALTALEFEPPSG